MERTIKNETRQYLLRTIFLAEGDSLDPAFAAEYSMCDDEDLVYIVCEILESKTRVLDELIKSRQNGI
jgi:hypothetical protein